MRRIPRYTRVSCPPPFWREAASPAEHSYLHDQPIPPCGRTMTRDRRLPWRSSDRRPRLPGGSMASTCTIARRRPSPTPGTRYAVPLGQRTPAAWSPAVALAAAARTGLEGLGRKAGGSRLTARRADRRRGGSPARGRWDSGGPLSGRRPRVRRPPPTGAPACDHSTPRRGRVLDLLPPPPGTAEEGRALRLSGERQH